MADFNISEEQQLQDKKEAQKRKYIPIIIIVIISLCSGLLVFIISNLLFGNNSEPAPQENPNQDTKISINDSTVKSLYGYVTYTTGPNALNKFIKEKSVTQADFTNYEKYYYALQFADKTDFIDTNNKDEQNRKIYLLPEDKMKQYMSYFFGKNMTYSTDETINYKFNFNMPEGNVGILNHSKNSNGYHTIFTVENDTGQNNIIKEYYSKLESAEKKSNNSIILKENIIYTKVIIHDNLYDIEIYKDYEKTNLIDKKQNIPTDKITQDIIDIDDYKDKSATITYTFDAGKDNYYFVSSKITN